MRPGTSRLRLASPARDSVTYPAAMAKVITPTGTLIRKIQPQCRCWLIRPPSTGPSAKASAPTAAQMPIAVLRCLGLVNVAMMMASVVGISSAAPTPWTARLAISTAPLPARPAASEETVNSAIPARKSRRRPNTSASLPPTSSSPASVSR